MRVTVNEPLFVTNVAVVIGYSFRRSTERDRAYPASESSEEADGRVTWTRHASRTPAVTGSGSLRQANTHLRSSAARRRITAASTAYGIPRPDWRCEK